jgi:hypothetical protein
MYVVECGEFNDIIAWSNDGLSFCINNTLAFEKAVLPVVFKAAKWESFARKLARWGFKRIRLTGTYAEQGAAFIHPQFRRGDFDLSKLMSCANEDHADTEEQQVVSILASLNSSREPANTPPEVRGVFDAACAPSGAALRRAEYFVQRQMAMCEGNDVNATRTMVSIPELKATRKQEPAPIVQDLRRDYPRKAEGRVMSRQFQMLADPKNSSMPGLPARSMNYTSSTPASSFRTTASAHCIGDRYKESHRQNPQLLTNSSASSITRTNSSYNSLPKRQGGYQGMNSDFLSSSNDILRGCIPPIPINTSGLKGHSLMQALMHNNSQIKKRKMTNDTGFETSHSSPLYLRRTTPPVHNRKC